TLPVADEERGVRSRVVVVEQFEQEGEPALRATPGLAREAEVAIELAAAMTAVWADEGMNHGSPYRVGKPGRRGARNNRKGKPTPKRALKAAGSPNAGPRLGRTRPSRRLPRRLRTARVRTPAAARARDGQTRRASRAVPSGCA